MDLPIRLADANVTMLGLLQRTLILAAVLASAIWALACVWTNRPWHAADVALIIAGLYVVLLSLEFVFLAATSGASGGLSRPSRRQLFRAWKGEVAASSRVFLWQQPFAAHQWPDLLPPTPSGQRGVLLVHGYFCNRGFWNAWTRRLTAKATPYIAISLEPVFGSIADYSEQIEQAIARLEAATGMAPVVVAHSMGGLAVRWWWSAHQRQTMPEVDQTSTARVQHLITLGTPHHGTWLARFAVTANAREMRLGSKWLEALNDHEPADHRRRTTCFYSPCDNIVFPTWSATLPEANNVPLAEVAHVAMAGYPQPYDTLQQHLLMPEMPWQRGHSVTPQG